MSDVSETARINREVFLKTMVPRSRGTLWVTSRMAEAMEDVDVRAGGVIFEAGSSAEHYYFVVAGDVEMTRPGARPWTVTGPGLVGVVDVALGRPHLRAAVAKGDARLLRLEVAVWMDALEDSFDLTYAVLQNMAQTVYGLRMRPPPSGGFDATPDAMRSASLRTVVDRILFMRDVALFGHAATQALTTLAEATETMELSPGDALFGKGVHPERIFVVASGEVEAVHDTAPIVGKFRCGSVVAGPAAFVRQNGGFSARATVATTVLAVDLDDYFDVMEEHFTLVRSAMMFMASDVDALLERDATRSPGPNVR